MSDEVSFGDVPCGLASSLIARGFTVLTPIQHAVLATEVADRDLRLSSETGSGKTVAIGLAVATQLGELAPRTAASAKTPPRALIIAPTRELAAQLERELNWLYRPLNARLAVVTGGTNIGGDFRALATAPHIVVGTPGRLVDHVNRGSLDLSALEVVVLDEADEMLDMGFRDDLELLLERTPSNRRTHLVSATFPRDVLHLANRYQQKAVVVAGTAVGAPNQDITHIAVAVQDRYKTPALINVLLASLRQRTLVFARTRVGTTALANELNKNGFAAASLNGDMGQRERTATLESFRSGVVDILVATDVAARGLDIEDIAQVIHFDMPENDETLTHRSGRTGRAGNKGTSIVFVPPQSHHRARTMFRRLGVSLNWQNAPTPAQVRDSADARLMSELADSEAADDTNLALARQLLEQYDAEQLVAGLLARSLHRGPCEPSHVPEAKPATKPREQRGVAPRRRGNFTRFHVSWGASAGANPGRLLAMVCRRGRIRSHQVGAIKVTGFSSMIEVSSEVAADFARAAKRPDPREPKIHIRPWRDDKAHSKKPHPKKRSAFRRFS